MGRGQPRTHRLGGLDEHFAPPELELITVHVDRLQQVEDTLLLVSSPRRPGFFGQDGIPVRTVGERRIRLSDWTATQRRLVLLGPGNPFTSVQWLRDWSRQLRSPLGPGCLLLPPCLTVFMSSLWGKSAFPFYHCLKIALLKVTHDSPQAKSNSLFSKPIPPDFFRALNSYCRVL